MTPARRLLCGAAQVVAIGQVSPDRAAGFAFCVFGTTLTGHLATAAVFPDDEPGSRYTALPIFLIECPIAAGRKRGCQLSRSGEITEVVPGPLRYTFPCDRIRSLRSQRGGR